MIDLRWILENWEQVSAIASFLFCLFIFFDFIELIVMASYLFQLLTHKLVPRGLVLFAGFLGAAVSIWLMIVAHEVLEELYFWLMY
jgi:hypothetical protein